MVLDFTAGSGSFGVAAVLEGRGFIQMKEFDNG
jgi:DNA modification methylase